MRNDNWMKGEFFFKALINSFQAPAFNKRGSVLSPESFASKDEARAAYPDCKWPAEDLAGVIFCPDPEELK